MMRAAGDIKNFGKRTTSSRTCYGIHGRFIQKFILQTGLGIYSKHGSLPTQG